MYKHMWYFLSCMKLLLQVHEHCLFQIFGFWYANELYEFIFLNVKRYNQILYYYAIS